MRSEGVARHTSGRLAYSTGTRVIGCCLFANRLQNLLSNLQAVKPDELNLPEVMGSVIL